MRGCNARYPADQVDGRRAERPVRYGILAPDSPAMRLPRGVWGSRCADLAEVDGRLVGMMNLAIFERMPRPGRPASYWG